jgi:adenine-specific DNA glycosylase
MWQFVTVPVDDSAKPTALSVRTGEPRPLGAVTHGLTHRRYHFEVFACDATGAEEVDGTVPRAWVTLDGLSDYPLPRPHLKVAEMLRALS